MCSVFSVNVKQRTIWFDSKPTTVYFPQYERKVISVRKLETHNEKESNPFIDMNKKKPKTSNKA